MIIIDLTCDESADHIMLCNIPLIKIQSINISIQTSYTHTYIHVCMCLSNLIIIAIEIVDLTFWICRNLLLHARVDVVVNVEALFTFLKVYLPDAERNKARRLL